MKKSVFIVEDQHHIRDHLKNLIREAGFTIAGENFNGRDAVSEIVEMDVPPDIVLMDTGMPLMDGYTAAGIISETYPEISVILTGNGEIDDCLAARSGAAGVISKDLAPDAYMFQFARIAGAILFAVDETSVPSHIYM